MTWNQPRQLPNRRLVCSPVRLIARIVPPVLLFAFTVWAVCSQPPPRVCTEFFDSDAVFTGTVIGVRNDPPDSSDSLGWFYRLGVLRNYRGSAGRTIEVYTENASARYPLELGRSYLLFAGKLGDRLEITCCGNSAYLEEAGDKIRQIEQIKRTKSGGEIAGRIGWGDPDNFVSVRIVVVGEKQTYRALTDRFGWFHIPVPDGTYKVHVDDREPPFLPFDLSYNDPNHIVVHPGGCPQVQLMPGEWFKR